MRSSSSDKLPDTDTDTDPELVESSCSAFPPLHPPNILISPPRYKSSSSSRRIGTIIGGVIGGIVLCLLAATSAFLFNRYHRKLRSKKTQQFVMRKGLVISASPPVPSLGAGDVKMAAVSLFCFLFSGGAFVDSVWKV